MVVDNETFVELYEDQSSRIFLACISLISSLTSLPFYFGVIWYEHFGSDKKRTVINKLSSSVFLCGIFWILFVQIPEALIHIFPMQAESLCLAQNVCKRTLLLQIMLISDAVIIFRYERVLILNLSLLLS